MRTRTALTATSLLAGMTGVAAYLGLVTGAMPVDLGVGRRTRPLGPLQLQIDAPRDVVYAAITAPYGERVTRAMRAKVEVLERGQDLVLAAHYTPIRGRLRATTVETVRLTPPGRVDFRLVRGPVPQVAETFLLTPSDGGTLLSYTGTLGTDLWGLGQVWGDLVARPWEAAVRSSFEAVKAEAERRHPRRPTG